MPWRPEFNRTQCPDDAKSVGHQTCRKQNSLLWTKQDKLRFTSLTISPETAAVEWYLITNLLSVQLLSLQSIMCFDHALYMAAYFSQNIVSPVVQAHLSTPLSFALIWGLTLVGKQYKTFLWHCKDSRTRDHQNCCFSWTKVLIGDRKNRSFWILISLWPETDRNVHHCRGFWTALKISFNDVFMLYILCMPLICLCQ